MRVRVLVSRLVASSGSVFSLIGRSIAAGLIPRQRAPRAVLAVCVAWLGCSARAPSQPVPATTEASRLAPDAGAAPSADAAPLADAPTPATLADIGIDPADLDRTADPCADFFQYACGGWIARATTGAPVSRMDEVEERTAQALRTLLEDTGGPATREQAVASEMYRACMDTNTIEQAGLADVRALLDSARSSAQAKGSAPAPAAVLGLLHGYGIWAGFSLSVVHTGAGRDAVLVLDTGALGLPSRASYLDPDKDAERLRRRYQEHIATVFALAGRNAREAKNAANDVVRLETELARVAETAVARRRSDDWFRRIERPELDRLARGFDWDGYFAHLEQAMGGPGLSTREAKLRLAVSSDEYLARMIELARGRRAAFAHYLEWRVLDEMTPVLPPAFAEARARWYDFLAGRTRPRPERWRACVHATDRALGEVLGRAYAARYVSPAASAAARSAVDALRKALRDRVGASPWLSAQAKAKAQTKLDRLVIAVGAESAGGPADAPEPAGGFAAQTLTARAFEVRRQLAPLAAAPAPAPWYGQRVDGWYDPRDNRLTLGAALLQPPFFVADRPQMMNLGSLSLIAGHELIHVVDDVGAAYDETGAAARWWSADDERAYKERAQCLVRAYQGEQPAAQAPLVRSRTAREDAADLGGLALAYQALDAAGAETRGLPGGLTRAQSFFVAAAQSLCAIDAGAPDGHRSPARERVNRALSQLEPFDRAFQCAQGTATQPARPRCSIW